MCLKYKHRHWFNNEGNWESLGDSLKKHNMFIFNSNPRTSILEPKMALFVIRDSYPDEPIPYPMVNIACEVRSAHNRVT